MSGAGTRHTLPEARTGLRRRLRRVRRSLWPSAQTALAAALAWALASLVNDNPFFPPISAVISLGVVPHDDDGGPARSRGQDRTGRRGGPQGQPSQRDLVAGLLEGEAELRSTAIDLLRGSGLGFDEAREALEAAAETGEPPTDVAMRTLPRPRAARD